MPREYSFDPKAMQAEADLVRQGGLTQIGSVLRVLLTNAGIVPGGDSSGWFQLPLCNGLTLHKNIAFPVGGSAPVMVSSSAIGRVLVQFNRDDSPWIAFSLIQNAADWFSAVGTIRQVRFVVQTTDAGAYFYFTPLTAFGLVSSGYGGGGAAGGGYQHTSSGGGFGPGGTGQTFGG